MPGTLRERSWGLLCTLPSTEKDGIPWGTPPSLPPHWKIWRSHWISFLLSPRKAVGSARWRFFIFFFPIFVVCSFVFFCFFFISFHSFGRRDPIFWGMGQQKKKIFFFSFAKEKNLNLNLNLKLNLKLNLSRFSTPLKIPPFNRALFQGRDRFCP